jgi:DNA-binding NarL/FixJ family response regulator
MLPMTVIVAQSNAHCAESMAAYLHGHFASVLVASSPEELRREVARYRADVAIIDLELIDVNDVEELHGEFPSTNIICTHRLADEELWTASLSAGAQDFCMCDDVRGILDAMRRVPGVAHTQIAA